MIECYDSAMILVLVDLYCINPVQYTSSIHSISKLQDIKKYIGFCFFIMHSSSAVLLFYFLQNIKILKLKRPTADSLHFQFQRRARFVDDSNEGN